MKHNATVLLAAVCGNATIKELALRGVDSLEHAKIIAVNLVGSQSIAYSVALYVQSVSLDNGDFEFNPGPDFFAQGVTIEETEHLAEGAEIAAESGGYWDGRTPGYSEACGVWE